jgi:methionine biosynthesis protein MetW
LLARGRIPETEALNQAWYETPNIHLCTIRDFVILCGELGLRIERRSFLTHEGKAGRFHNTGLWANFFGEQGLFVLRAS